MCLQGLSFPAAQALWSRWAPPRERNLLTNVGYAGSDLGTVISMTASGVISAEIGWPAVFYIFGSIGLAWTVLWILVVRRGPDEDNFIDPRERQYIEESLGGQLAQQLKRGQEVEDDGCPGHPSTSITDDNVEEVDQIYAQSRRNPWKSLLTSVPVWAVLVANFTANWGFYTLLTYMPTFVKETLNFNIEESGILSALPSLLMLFILPMAGLLADWLINREFLTIGQVRKAFCCGSFLGQAALMMVVAFLMKPAVAVTSLSLAVGVGAFAFASFFVNPLDIAPPYASIIVGLSNTAGTVPGIISPILIGYIVPNRTESEWQLVFLITSAIYIMGTIFYGMFASGERQHWATTGKK